MKTITTITEGEKEEKDTLNNEIQTWKGLEYALREENSSLLFNKMLTECQDNEEEYSKATAARGEPYSAEESLFMALIFEKQKMIS